jgi:hypothetical protein
MHTTLQITLLFLFFSMPGTSTMDGTFAPMPVFKINFVNNEAVSCKPAPGHTFCDAI